MLQNKMCELEVAVSRVKPCVLGVSEANLHDSVGLARCQLPGYTLHLAMTMVNPSIRCSRVVVYVK